MEAEATVALSGFTIERKNALRKRSFVELSSLPEIHYEAIRCEDSLGHLWIVRRNLSDGCIMVVLRGYWPHASLDHFAGFVKMPDESWSEGWPELHDEALAARLRKLTTDVYPA